MSLVSLDAAKVEQRIQQLEYSRKEVCKQVGIPTITLRRWLNGEVKNIKIKNASKLADALDCSVADISENAESGDILSNDEHNNMIKSFERTGGFVHLSLSENIEASGLLIKSMFRKNLSRKNHVKIYYWLAFSGFLGGNFGRLKKYSDKCFKSSIKHPDPHIQSYGYLIKGISRIMSGERDCSQYFLKSIELNQENFINRGLAYYLLAYRHYIKGDYNQCLTYAYKGLVEMEKVKLKAAKAQLYTYLHLTIAVCHIHFGRLDHAASTMEKARISSTEQNWQRTNAFVEISMAEYLSESGDHISAMALFNKGYKKLDDWGLYQNYVGAIGVKVFTKAGQFDKVEKLIQTHKLVKGEANFVFYLEQLSYYFYKTNKRAKFNEYASDLEKALIHCDAIERLEVFYARTPKYRVS